MVKASDLNQKSAKLSDGFSRVGSNPTRSVSFFFQKTPTSVYLNYFLQFRHDKINYKALLFTLFAYIFVMRKCTNKRREKKVKVAYV